MNFRYATLGKDSILNEDSVLAEDNRIAVSDGAGGGGMFADKWSSYLLQHLPAHPIRSFNVLDEWIDRIWELFYNQHETIAKGLGSAELNKFYDEGSLATLAVLWVVKSSVEWMSYGDSAVFCYDFESKELLTNMQNPLSFNDAPYLINVNAPLSEEGFNFGTFTRSDSKWFFCASDALAHYIFVSYMVANLAGYQGTIQTMVNAKTKNSNYVRAIKSEPRIDFEKEVLIKIFNSAKNKANFAKHLQKLQRNGKLAYDDYSIAFLY